MIAAKWHKTAPPGPSCRSTTDLGAGRHVSVDFPSHHTGRDTPAPDPLAGGPVIGVHYTFHPEGPDYLLFLKKGRDGSYEPVNGQIDPVLSVRELREPEQKGRE